MYGVVGQSLRAEIWGNKIIVSRSMSSSSLPLFGTIRVHYDFPALDSAWMKHTQPLRTHRHCHVLVDACACVLYIYGRLPDISFSKIYVQFNLSFNVSFKTLYTLFLHWAKPCMLIHHWNIPTWHLSWDWKLRS